jgi:hypothetical protein
MYEYSEISYEKDYDAKRLSANISCHSMSALSSQYTQNQNRVFSDNIDIERCQMHNAWNENVDSIKDNESRLLKGFSINKKSCIFKRPKYNSGDWSDQFQYSDLFANNFNSYKLFDYQTKAKGTKEPIICDYSRVKIKEECDKGPYFLYTNTFSSDHYNCLK